MSFYEVGGGLGEQPVRSTMAIADHHRHTAILQSRALPLPELIGVLQGPPPSFTVSKIFAWFREDFGDDEAAVLRYLSARGPDPIASQLAGRTIVTRYAYDWGLNDGSTGAIRDVASP